MKFPVPSSELLDMIPHRPPMVWIDHVTAVDATGGEATMQLRADGLYMSTDGLRPSSVVEFLAQAFGFIGVCRQVLMPIPGAPTILKKALLVSIRNVEMLAEMSHPSLQPGQTLTITMFGKKDIGPIQLTDGRITSADGELLAIGHLKVYAEY